MVAALGVAGCSTGASKTAPSPASPMLTPASSPLAAPPTAALPPPEALTDVLNRLADPNVPGLNKVGLVEGATPESAGTLDKFVNALRDNGYLPMTYTASNVAWSDKNPSDVSATVSIDTARADKGVLTFPMEFAPYQGGWQLSRRTAEMLLALSSTAVAPPPPAPSTTAPG